MSKSVEIIQRRAQLSPEQRALLDQRLRGQNAKRKEVEIIPRQFDSEYYPVSFAQRRLWFIDQFEPNSSLYNIPAAMRLHGRLDQRALQQAFNKLIQRHESLRTTFGQVDGRPVQIIAQRIEVDPGQKDFSTLPSELREASVREA